MKLYSYWRSSAAYRVRIALALKGVSVEYLPVNLLTGENRAESYAAISPQKLLPTLEVDGHYLFQSLAILEYLEERYPTPALLPDDAIRRAYVRGLAQMVACEIHPLNNPRVLKYITGEMQQSEEAKKAWYAHWVQEGFDGVENALVRYGFAGRFCCGDEPTIADICLIPQVYNARRYAIDLSPFTNIVRIAEHAMKHPAFEQAAPEHQSDAA